MPEPSCRNVLSALFAASGWTCVCPRVLQGRAHRTGCRVPPAARVPAPRGLYRRSSSWCGRCRQLRRGRPCARSRPPPRAVGCARGGQPMACPAQSRLPPRAAHVLLRGRGLGGARRRHRSHAAAHVLGRGRGLLHAMVETAPSVDCHFGPRRGRASSTPASAGPQARASSSGPEHPAQLQLQNLPIGKKHTWQNHPRRSRHHATATRLHCPPPRCTPVTHSHRGSPIRPAVAA